MVTVTLGWTKCHKWSVAKGWTEPHKIVSDPMLDQIHKMVTVTKGWTKSHKLVTVTKG